MRATVIPTSRTEQAERLREGSRMNRYEVKITPEDLEYDRIIHTFTWAETLEKAEARMADHFAATPETWTGWTYEISE